MNIAILKSRVKSLEKAKNKKMSTALIIRLVRDDGSIYKEFTISSNKGE